MIGGGVRKCARMIDSFEWFFSLGRVNFKYWKCRIPGRGFYVFFHLNGWVIVKKRGPVFFLWRPLLFVFSFLPPAWFGWVRVLGCVLNRGQEWFFKKIFNDILANFLPPPWLGEWVGRCVARHGQWVIARTDANHPPPTNGQRQNCPKLTEDRLCIFCFGWHRNWPKVKADFVVATPNWCFGRLYSSFASTFHIRPREAQEQNPISREQCDHNVK